MRAAETAAAETEAVKSGAAETEAVKSGAAEGAKARGVRAVKALTKMSVRARLTLLVGLATAAVLSAAAVVGPGLIGQSLVSGVLDDAAAAQAAAHEVLHAHEAMHAEDEVLHAEGDRGAEAELADREEAAELEGVAKIIDESIRAWVPPGAIEGAWKDWSAQIPADWALDDQVWDRETIAGWLAKGAAAMEEVATYQGVTDARDSMRRLRRAGLLGDVAAALKADDGAALPVLMRTGRVVRVPLAGKAAVLPLKPDELGSPVVTGSTLADLAYEASGGAGRGDLDELIDPPAAPSAGAFRDVSRFVIDTRRVGGAEILVAADTSDVARSVEQVEVILWAAAPIMAAAAALVTWLLTGRALRPVDRMTERVRAINAGTLHERVPSPGTGDEIDRLAGTMNSMLERIERHDIRLRRFVTDAAHELRTPVAVLRAEAEVALRRGADPSVPDPSVSDPSGPDPSVSDPSASDPSASDPSASDPSGPNPSVSDPSGTDLASGVLAESLRLQRIVDDLLVLARHDETSPGETGSGAAAPRPGVEEIDLDDVVLAEVERARAVPVDVAAVSAGRVSGPADSAARVVAHLLDNAARHARSRVAVALRTEPSGEVVLTVDDDGEGIAPEDRRRVFERFTRLGEARTRDNGGAGLGLAVVASLVREMGGTVTVGDSPLGGARFELRFPPSGFSEHLFAL